MSRTDTQKAFYELCHTSKFIPIEVAAEFEEKLRAEGNNISFSVGLEDFRDATCPNCGTHGFYKYHFLGKLKHTDCGWNWFIDPWSYTKRQFAKVFSAGLKFASFSSDEAEKEGEKQGCFGFFFSIIFGMLFRLPFAILMIPIQMIFSLSQTKPATDHTINQKTMKEDILEAVQPEMLKPVISSALKKAGITSLELLKDDVMVNKAAELAYDNIPLVPYRAAIKATIGKEGFTKLIFQVRDKMLEMGTLDISWLNTDFMKSTILSKLQISEKAKNTTNDLNKSQVSSSLQQQEEKIQTQNRTTGDPQDSSISQPIASEAEALVNEFLQPDKFMEAYNSALNKTGIIYATELSDEANVSKISNVLWSQVLPNSLSIAIKATMGEEKFNELIITACDRMLVSGAIDISFLTPGRSFYLNKCSVHGLPQNEYAICSGCRNDPEIAIVSCPKCSYGERAIHIGHVSNPEFDRTCLVCASGRS